LQKTIETTLKINVKIDTTKKVAKIDRAIVLRGKI
jgi:hypothetical protein